MKLFEKITACIISTILITCISEFAYAKNVSKPNKDEKKVSIGNPSVQHIFFKDTYGRSKLNAHLIKVDMNNPRINLDLALAHNNTNRKENVSKIAKRAGAIAAINASFFHSRNSIDGAVGLIMSEGIVISDSGHRRTSLGITEDKKIIIGVPKIKNYVIMPELGENIRLNGINQIRGKNHNTVYNNYFGKTTRTKGSGREIMVDRDGYIIGYKMNNAPIPDGGFVISMSKANSLVSEKYPIGTQVYLDSVLNSPWNQVRTLVTGSPQLVKNGKIYNTYSKEKLQSSLAVPAKRTAVGVTSNNKLLMLTVTGNLSLTKLAQIMKRLGAKDAMALDGGGSTDMYLNGKTVVTNYRPVTNALVVKVNRDPKF
ncbi:MAG: phosphodiester glycosidase family protein [Candidatus Sericytochromatia bacterium]